jgi:hypothetical protein
MSAFISGFTKTAAAAGLLEKGLKAARIAGKGALQVGGGILEGAKDSLKVPLGKHLNPLKGMGDISQAAKAQGGVMEAFKRKSGREEMGKAIGKAAPSLAAGAGYAYGAKKLYDKTLGSSSQNQGYYSQ